MTTYIDGTVENEFGQPLPDSLVGLTDRLDGSYLSTFTDNGGDYEFTVTAYHHYDLTVWHSGYTIESQYDIIAEEDTFTLVNFTPPDHNLHASVIGTVQDDEGLPVENANVWGVGSSYIFGCKTEADGQYVLPLHRADTYTIKATKNNFTIKSNVSVTQSGNHPTSSTTVDFTGSYCLERNLGTTRLGFAVYDRAVVVPDLLYDSYDLIHADSPAESTVFMKTRRWGSGGVLWTTYSGGYDADEGDGSGGSNYDGDCGDCGE